MRELLASLLNYECLAGLFGTLATIGFMWLIAEYNREREHRPWF